MRDTADLIGRIFISFIFLFEAFDSFFYYYAATKDKMTLYGLNWQQDFLLVIVIIILLIGGLFLLIGYRSGFAALCLILYWAPLTFIIHDFWNFPRGLEQRLQSVLFMKNVAVVGGLLMVIAHGSGRFSIKRLLDHRRLRPRRWGKEEM